MVPSHRKQIIIFGILFGAWMGGVYASVSGAINVLFLPNIPVAPPDGGLVLSIFEYTLFGALLGAVSAYPESKLVGMGLGGLTTALILVFISLTRSWGTNIFGGALLYLACTFMPLIVLMMPVSLLVRAGVDAQQVRTDKPYLWARKYLIPLALTLVAIILGSFSLYTPEQRLGLVTTNQIIIQAKQAGSVKELPVPLQAVSGYLENAHGPYTLAWSDHVESFFGPRPEGAELSQFLIIARYQNGFSFACVFSSNRTVPTCAVYE
jgi:hypothetical protein